MKYSVDAAMAFAGGEVAEAFVRLEHNLIQLVQLHGLDIVDAAMIVEEERRSMAKRLADLRVTLQAAAEGREE